MTRDWRTLPFWRWAPGMRFHALGDSFMVVRCTGGPAMVLNSGPISSFRRWSQEELGGSMTLVEDAALLGHVQQLIAEECVRRDLALAVVQYRRDDSGFPFCVTGIVGADQGDRLFLERYECASLAEALWAVACWLQDNPVEVSDG